MNQISTKHKNFSKSSIGTKLACSVKFFDSYGIPFTLTLNQKEIFKTIPGGILSIITKLGILIYFFTLIPQVVFKKKDVQFKNMKVNWQNDNDPFFLTENNFDIAIRLTTLLGPLSDEMLYNRSKYLKFEASTSTFYQTVVDGQTVNNVGTYRHELGPCSSDRFANLTQDTLDLGITGVDWLCPKSVRTNITGTPQTFQRQAFRIRVVPCNKAAEAFVPDDSVSCASDVEIEKAIQEHFIQIAILREYFDENEFEESPIKKEVLSKLYNIDSTIASFNIQLFQRVNIITRDSWVSNQLMNENYQYYELLDNFPPSSGYYKPARNDMLTLMFMKYDHEVEITRQVVSLSDIISKCGGFASFIMFLGLQFSKLFQPYLLKQLLIKNLFTQQTMNQVDPQVGIKSKDIENQNQVIDIDKLLQEMKNRKPPDINILRLKCKSWMGCLYMGKKKQQQWRQIKHAYYSYDTQLKKTMDIKQIVDTIRNTNMLMHLILKKSYIRLIPFMNNTLIKTPDKLDSKNQGTPYTKQNIDRDTFNSKQLKKSLEKLIGSIHLKKRSQKLLDFLISTKRNSIRPSIKNINEKNDFSQTQTPKVQINTRKLDIDLLQDDDSNVYTLKKNNGDWSSKSSGNRLNDSSRLFIKRNL